MLASLYDVREERSEDRRDFGIARRLEEGCHLEKCLDASIAASSFGQETTSMTR